MVDLQEEETILDLVLTLATDTEETIGELRDDTQDLLPLEAVETEITGREDLTAALPAILNDEVTQINWHVCC
jgi:hypothetical protein